MSLSTAFQNLSSALTGILHATPRIYNLTGSSLALFLSLRDEPYLAVEETEAGARRLFEDIGFFIALRYPSDVQRPSVFFLPDPDGPEVSGKRAEAVFRIGDDDALVASVQAVKSPVWSRDDLQREMLVFARGQERARETVGERLRNLGYRRVSIVVETGEYCLKGWLLDIFPSTSGDPVRIEFFGDEVERIRTFDIETQKSLQEREQVSIFPASERSSGGSIFPLMHGTRYLIDLGAEEREAVGTGSADAVILSRFAVTGEGVEADFLSLRGLGITPDERRSLSDFVSGVSRALRDHCVLIVSSSTGQAERMKDILFEGGVIAPVIETQQVRTWDGSVAIVVGTLSSGLFVSGILVLTEREIFGERPSFRPLRKSKISGLLAAIDDIAPGDFVVHKDHGIGRFVTIHREERADYRGDLMVIEYSGGDRLYLPPYSIDRVKKYSAEEGVLPHLDKLGGKGWFRRKERVRKAVREMAEKLLRLYAERAVAEGFSFSRGSELHREFYEFFPYEETSDQIKAFEEISRDMEAKRPMERLLCGDVGYGKTEVAMRAAFKSVYDGKQVAVLVPTTILCEQHYLTFLSRFAAFPVRIDFLSRFKSRKEQDETMRALAGGGIDILIATHSLFRKGVAFSDLGLLIIDEEHRFGVGQKERIKELKKGVDVLSMTATPIPRTLQMALSGIRGMSLIETPPEERLAVRSIVSIFTEDVIREAVERELQRKGQILFVHNTIFDIGKIFDTLKRLIPHARIDVAHGRMPERRLEDVMHRFIRGDLEVLVSTNIIGSGLDIPTANTIIIDRADKMGLADLYQLRGRVGRSNVKAYAYFLIPGEDFVTDEAKKRLQAIREMSYLGAGFRLAMKDMEIRGAGNLLGPQQSGHIHAVGLDLYVETLEEAVAELKGMPAHEEVEPVIRIGGEARIPEGYIEDLTIRMSIYRRVAGARARDDLDDLEAEMRDRFGDLPAEVRRLIEIMNVKIMAKRLFITAITEANGTVRVVFSDKTQVHAEKIFCLRDVFEGIRFHKDGFELDRKGLPENRPVTSVLSDVMMRLR